MLVSVLPFEGLKHPSDRSSPKLIELLVRFKTELFTYERIGSHVGLLVSGLMSALVVRSPVSPRNRKIGSRTKKTERSRTTALRTGWRSNSSQAFLIRSASASKRARNLVSLGRIIKRDIMIFFISYITEKQLPDILRYPAGHLS